MSHHHQFLDRCDQHNHRAEDFRHIQAIKPAIGALNMGSMNYAKYNPRKQGFVFEFVFPNPFSEIVRIVRAMNEVGTKPEMECFDLGHIGNSYPLIDMGMSAAALSVQPDHGCARRHCAYNP